MKTKENLTNIEKNDTIETPAAAAKNAGVLKIKKKNIIDNYNIRTMFVF